ncbi:hypothetical protein TSTA_040150, partial [Talaromyces stipitatus ATCC 10500]
INDALNTRNRPSSTLIHRLPLNLDVLVWREGGTRYPGKWKGPYKLISINRETCTIDLLNGPTKFRSTVVKLYHKDDDPKQENTNNNDKAEPYSAPTAPLIELSNLRSHYMNQITPNLNHNAHNANAAYHLDIRMILRTYDESRKKEVNGLLERDIPPEARIYGFRFVDEIKNKGTNKVFEKLQLVVQAYNDKDKEFILTQSPTIQRSSQRLILCIGASKDN